MDAQSYENEIMYLIVHSGDARTYSLKALEYARNGNIEQALAHINKASEELNAAHASQMKMIQREINGEEFKITLLTIHAQDHLMNSMTIRDLAKEIILMKKEDKDR